jgi:predicted SAM-dependent methyltransferase
MKLVNIGCGYHYHPDWINLDLYRAAGVVYHDLRRLLPFPEASVDAVYHSHVLEHIDKDKAEKFTRDCYRVLKPGGIIRVVVPDLEEICREYLKNLAAGFDTGNQASILNYQWNKIEMLDQITRRRPGGQMVATLKSGAFNREYLLARQGEELAAWLEPAGHSTPSASLATRIISFLRRGRRLARLRELLASLARTKDPQRSGEAHRWMYDRLDLKLLLMNAGFQDFRLVRYDESRITDWKKYSLDKARGGDYPRKPDSLFAEASKPL